MFRRLSGLVAIAGLFGLLAIGLSSAPASAQVGWGVGGSSYSTGGNPYWYPPHVRYKHYRRPPVYVAPPPYVYHRHYKPYRRHHNDFAVGVGIGLLGAIIANQAYDPYVYTPGPAGFCHVHSYKVRGMTFHRDVRCYRHRYWDHPSIVYVR